jgi:hypothetical protein
MRWMLMGLFGLVLAVNILSLVKDVVFYYRNSWDFTQNSGERMVASNESRSNSEWEIPNRQRVTFATPIMIVILTAVLCAIYFIPESWYDTDF